MTAQPSWSSTSQDTIFLTYIEGLPVPLRDAMYQKKLVDPGLLRAHPSDTAENLGLDTSGRAATLVGGGIIGDGIDAQQWVLTFATPPTSITCTAAYRRTIHHASRCTPHHRYSNVHYNATPRTGCSRSWSETQESCKTSFCEQVAWRIIVS